MKKLFFIAFILVLILGCTEKRSEDTIKIGAVLPLTGTAAVYGENAQKGIDLAVKEINAKGGINGKLLQIIYEDDGTEPIKSVTSVKKLTEIDGVKIIIGGVWDFLANAIIPEIDRQKVILISTSALPDTVTEKSPYFYVFHSPVAVNQGVFEQWLKQLPGKNVAALVVNNPWGLAHLATFKKAAEATSVTLVEQRIVQNFDGNDLSTDIAIINGKKPDGIFATLNFNDLLMLSQKRKELNIQTPFLVHENFANLLTSGKIKPSGAEGITVFAFSQPASDFIEKFKQAYGEPPAFVGDIAYDIVYALKDAMKEGESVEAIQQGLKKIDFSGASGRIQLEDHYYPNNRKPYLEKVIDGKLELIS